MKLCLVLFDLVEYPGLLTRRVARRQCAFLPADCGVSTVSENMVLGFVNGAIHIVSPLCASPLCACDGITLTGQSRCRHRDVHRCPSETKLFSNRAWDIEPQPRVKPNHELNQSGCISREISHFSFPNLDELALCTPANFVLPSRHILRSGRHYRRLSTACLPPEPDFMLLRGWLRLVNKEERTFYIKTPDRGPLIALDFPKSYIDTKLLGVRFRFVVKKGFPMELIRTSIGREGNPTVDVQV